MTLRTTLGWLTVLLAVAACGPATSGGVAVASTAPPISHPAGSGDLVLRISVGGGFAGLPTTPHASLYGDGTFIYLDNTSEAPGPLGTVARQRPYRIRDLTEDEIQALLALATPAMGVAASEYRARGADFFTTVFELRAGGLDRRVSVFGLEAFDDQAAETAGISGLTELARAVGRQMTSVESTPYVPAAYAARLRHRLEAAEVVPWPWPELSIADFSPNAGNAALEGRLTAGEVAALHIPGVEGGLSGLVLSASDGRLYELQTRPLLPEDAGAVPS
jgi:hypothetical protein